MRAKGRALLLAAAIAAAACTAAEEDPLARPPADPLDAAEVAEAHVVLAGAGADVPATLERIIRGGDHRFVAPLLENLRATQLGLRDGAHYNAEVVALERLTGEAFGSDWLRWVGWYAATPLVAAPGFGAQKAALFARIDPRLGALLEGDPAEGVRVEEIVWSGNAVDQVEPLLDPPRVAAAEAAVPDEEIVVGVTRGDEAVAYPLRLLERHEVVNDRIGGQPVAVVHCALCGSATAFATGAPGGGRRRLGNAGLVYRSVRLLYDLESLTLYDELTGRALLGAGAAAGARLERLPVSVTTWAAWRGRHPVTGLVAPGEGPRLYAGYQASEETIFPVPPAPAELPPKDLVFGLEVGLRARAFALAPLLEARVLADAVGDRPVLLVATRGELHALARSARGGELHWSPGAEVRAYAGPAVGLVAGPDPDALRDAEGGIWRVDEDALVGPSGERHARLPGTLAYWFAWAALSGETTLWP